MANGLYPCEGSIDKGHCGVHAKLMKPGWQLEVAHRYDFPYSLHVGYSYRETVVIEREVTIMNWKLIVCSAAIITGLVLPASRGTAGNLPAPADSGPSYASLKNAVVSEYAGKKPVEWGETVAGVMTSLATKERVIALTLDACGSPTGKGIDAKLINFLVREGIPATRIRSCSWNWPGTRCSPSPTTVFCTNRHRSTAGRPTGSGARRTWANWWTRSS